MEELFEIDLSSVPRFLARWHGPPDRARASATRAAASSADLPPALSAWYDATSAYSRPVTCQNHVLGPGELVRDGDRLVFWAENQGVYEWAAGTAEDDPQVFERSTSGGEPWHATGVRLTEFLLTVAVFEAVMTQELSVSREELTPVQLAATVAPLRPLPVPGPMWGSRLYAAADGQHVLAFATPDAPDRSTWSVWVAAQDPAGLAYLETVAGWRSGH